jgi:hypothetical protein
MRGRLLFNVLPFLRFPEGQFYFFGGLCEDNFHEFGLPPFHL